jgi:hypothetical protein
MRSLSVVAVACLLGGTKGAAVADDDPPFVIGSQPAWILLGGVTTGGTIALADRGALVGGELSLARLSNGNVFGFYADGYYDWGVDGAYVTGGIELAKKFVSIDGGAALRFADGDRDLGVTGRLSLGLGVFSLYGRYMYFTDTMSNEHVIQIGVLLKMPLKTFGGM